LAGHFTDSHPEGLDGVFNDDEADNLVAIIRTFNETVDVRYGVA
jgi:type I restriction enzyme R subunit